MERQVKTPTHLVVYERLRDMVLFGDLAPGQAVTIQGLVDMLDVGMTPVREALRRLISEGALEQQGNRRVCVPELTPEGVDEIHFMRGNLEPELARRALARLANSDLKTLTAIDRDLDAAIARGDISTYLAQNYRFHAEIYRIADAPLITEAVNRLWLRFGPSLRIVCGRAGTSNLPDQHAELLSAYRRGDPEGAAKAMADDVAQGMEQIRLSHSS